MTFHFLIKMTQFQEKFEQTATQISSVNSLSSVNMSECFQFIDSQGLWALEGAKIKIFLML